MTTETSLPLDFPAVQTLARTRVEATWRRNTRRFAAAGWRVEERGTSMAAIENVDRLVQVEAEELADLTRPESRDLWARALAEKWGLTPGVTAPRWQWTLSGWELSVGPTPPECVYFMPLGSAPVGFTRILVRTSGTQIVEMPKLTLDLHPVVAFGLTIQATWEME